MDTSMATENKGEIRYIDGDVRMPVGEGNKIIIQCVNSWGLMASGVAKAIYEKWPVVKEKYHDWYNYPNRNKVKFGLGKVQLIQVEENVWVANIVGQHGIVGPSNPKPVRYEALEEGFATVAETAIQLNASIHSPLIAAGLAQGNWDIIEKLIIKQLVHQGLSVKIYQI